ncbi:MAG: MBL fold metallo-hydrolase [Deltaproteobacteria bacterium]|nr:MBL fold metallo-hydrolase [Deltaproteobacteria bacterium]
MLTTVKAGDFTVRGISVGGVYTSLFIPELHLILDAGAPARSFAGARTLFLSHAHADHVGALPGLLGIRGLVGKGTPLKVLMPAKVVEPIEQILELATSLQRYDLSIDAVGLEAGDVHALGGDLQLKAVRTYHPVPSLGMLVFRRIPKLKPEYRGLPGREIGDLRTAGADIFDYRERIELGYATDTLVEVLDRAPDLYRARVLILECTFLDHRKSIETARAGCHIHLDELIERADRFDNQHIVLMHFSQIYKPQEIAGILDDKLPANLRSRVIPFVPNTSHWPG